MRHETSGLTPSARRALPRHPSSIRPSLQVSDTGFSEKLQSLGVGLLADDSLLQVHPNGLRHIRVDKRVQEWRTPGRKAVMKVALNSKQVVISLSGGELVYFEAEEGNAGGSLVEREKRDMGGDVACLDVGPVPEGLLRSRFLAVGALPAISQPFLRDSTSLLQAPALRSLLLRLPLLLADLGLHPLTGQHNRLLRQHRAHPVAQPGRLPPGAYWPGGSRPSNRSRERLLLHARPLGSAEITLSVVQVLSLQSLAAAPESLLLLETSGALFVALGSFHRIASCCNTLCCAYSKAPPLW